MILGIDISTKLIAIAGIEKEKYYIFLLPSLKESWLERYQDLFIQFSKFLKENKKKIKKVYIEDPPFVQNHLIHSHLTRIAAICEIECFRYNIPFSFNL